MTNRRPWGDWTLIDQDDMSDKKILHLLPGSLLSLQFHGDENHPGHKETWLALTKIRAVVGDTIDDLSIIDIQPQGQLIINPGMIHALVNPFATDCYVMETRESQCVERPIDREENITRIYDQTNRGGLPSYPEALLKRIWSLKPDYEIV